MSRGTHSLLRGRLGERRRVGLILVVLIGATGCGKCAPPTKSPSQGREVGVALVIQGLDRCAHGSFFARSGETGWSNEDELQICDWLAGLRRSLSSDPTTRPEWSRAAELPLSARLTLLGRFRCSDDLGFLVLLGALLDHDSSVVVRARLELANAQGHGFDALAALAQHANSAPLRREVVRVLVGMNCGDKVAKALVSATADSDPDVQIEALRGLGACALPGRGMEPVFLNAIEASRGNSAVREEAALAMLRSDCCVEAASDVLRGYMMAMDRMRPGLREIRLEELLHRLLELGPMADTLCDEVLGLCTEERERTARNLVESDESVCWEAVQVVIGMGGDAACRRRVRDAYSQAAGRSRVATGLILLSWGESLEDSTSLLSSAIHMARLQTMRIVVDVLTRHRDVGAEVSQPVIRALGDVLVGSRGGFDVMDLAVRGLLLSGAGGVSRLRCVLRTSPPDRVLLVLHAFEDAPRARQALRADLMWLLSSPDWRVRQLASSLMSRDEGGGGGR